MVQNFCKMQARWTKPIYVNRLRWASRRESAVLVKLFDGYHRFQFHHPATLQLPPRSPPPPVVGLAALRAAHEVVGANLAGSGRYGSRRGSGARAIFLAVTPGELLKATRRTVADALRRWKRETTDSTGDLLDSPGTSSQRDAVAERSAKGKQLTYRACNGARDA
jgi:hypothetical protein